ncbi:glutamate dehydrogenase [Anaeramoeba flamelloides]|uniref:Glutamate dehydrogenase n=1 Tax=Anaeramoeba flamelloides TaxID=1746091 RepID=A0ABQ8XB29_9EUKA|nr:glutamate dehydrogenase [Anaeramoeba flamelloides]
MIQRRRLPNEVLVLMSLWWRKGGIKINHRKFTEEELQRITRRSTVELLQRNSLTSTMSQHQTTEQAQEKWVGS